MGLARREKSEGIKVDRRILGLLLVGGWPSLCRHVIAKIAVRN